MKTLRRITLTATIVCLLATCLFGMTAKADTPGDDTYVIDLVEEDQVIVPSVTILMLSDIKGSPYCVSDGTAYMDFNHDNEFDVLIIESDSDDSFILKRLYGVDKLTENYTYDVELFSEKYKHVMFKFVKDLIAVTGVELDKAECTLKKGESVTLTATVKPEDASNKNVSWTSSDATVATVDTNGKVSAVGVGKTTIKVTTKDGGKYAECSVTVPEDPVETISVTGVHLNKNRCTIQKGKSVTLTATVDPGNATNKKLIWTSNKESVAKVDATGKVSAVGVGNTIIRVTTEDGGKFAECDVTVPKEKVKLTAKKKTFKKNTKTKKYDITLKDSKGKAIKNAKIILKVNKKNYTAKTNSKGKAIFKINQLNKKGKFNATVKFAGNKNYTAASKKVTITVK